MAIGDKMRICQITPLFPYAEHLSGEIIDDIYPVGGVSQHVYFISSELARLGDYVTVITTKSPQHKRLSEVNLSNVDIKRVPWGLTIYSSPLPFHALSSLNPRQYDLIHAHTPRPGIAELAALRNTRAKCPFVLTYHNDISKGGLLGVIISTAYNRSIGAFALQHSDIIVTTTQSYALGSTQLKPYLHKVRAVPNGVDTMRFHPQLEPNKIRQRYDLGERDKVILFLGRLEPYKGCEYLITAFYHVVNNMRARLVMVGKGSLEQRLKAVTHDLGISDKVTFAGYVPDEDLPYYYAACDVFALPSVSSLEGFGIVQLEAMACGKPVITTTIPGPSEVDAEEVATIHVPPRNEKALAEAILKILRDNKLAETMGKNGRKLVEEKYSWAGVAQNLQELYCEVLSRRANMRI